MTFAEKKLPENKPRVSIIKSMLLFPATGLVSVVLLTWILSWNETRQPLPSKYASDMFYVWIVAIPLSIWGGLYALSWKFKTPNPNSWRWRLLVGSISGAVFWGGLGGALLSLALRRPAVETLLDYLHCGILGALGGLLIAGLVGKYTLSYDTTPHNLT